MSDTTVKCPKEKGKIYVLTKNTYCLHLRKTPSADSKENIVGIIRASQKPLLIHEGVMCKKQDDDSIWFRVIVYNTEGLSIEPKSGWVNAHYLRFIK